MSDSLYEAFDIPSDKLVDESLVQMSVYDQAMSMGTVTDAIKLIHLAISNGNLQAAIKFLDIISKLDKNRVQEAGILANKLPQVIFTHVDFNDDNPQEALLNKIEELKADYER